MKIVNEKIIEKWRPILESANIKSNFEIFSEFCEKQIMKNTQTRTTLENIDRTILTTCQKFINEKLEIYNTIILNDCIRSISFISEASLKPKVLIHLNVDFQ